MTTLRWPLLITFLLPACIAEPPGGGDDMLVDPPSARTDAGPDDVEPPRMPDEPVITLGPVPSTTYWSSVPVHGLGPANGRVLIETPVAGALTVEVGADGNFCTDVPLAEDTVNSVRLRGVSSAGVIGDAVMINISQEGSPPAPPSSPPARNMARNGSTSTSENVTGELDDIVDGNWDTVTGLQNALFDQDWVWVELTARSRIERVIVVSDESCPMEHYEVLFSNHDVPGAPTDSNENWTYSDVEVDWVATELSFEPFVTRHVAIRFVSQDCGNWNRGYHKLAELEVWSQPDATPPPQEAPSCLGGG